MVSSSSLLGAAGEHYVMSQLLRHGYIAALAPVGVPNADILVTDDLGDRLCAVQVKCRREKGADGGWHMKAKHEQLQSDSLFYVFVDFGPEPTSTPTCYVVPSKDVADTLRSAHEAWMAQPGKDGRPHKPSDLRRFLPDYSRVKLEINRRAGWLAAYREDWGSLRTAPDRLRTS